MGAGLPRGGVGGGGRSRRRSAVGGVRMAEINVTPFVDVMLVLLIIFMVAAPLLQVGVPVELPETAAGPLPPEEEVPLTVSVTASGQIVLQESEIEEERLIPLLLAVAQERSNNKVFLRADGAVPYARVAKIMGALNNAGFNDIGLVTSLGGPAFGGAAQ